MLPGKTHTVTIEGASAVSASFQFSPGESPSAVDLPLAAPALILFMGFGEGRIRVQCNRPSARLTIGGEHATIGTGETNINVPDGDHLIEVEVPGGKTRQLKVSTAKESGATLGFYWGEPRVVAPPPPVPIDSMLDQAEQDKSQSLYSDADKLVDEVLKQSPESQRAQKLKQQLDNLNKLYPWRKPIL